MYIFLTLGAIIVTLYMLISHFIFKRRLNISEKKIYPFSKTRHMLFSLIEMIVIVAFVIVMVVYVMKVELLDHSLIFVSKLGVVLSFVVQVIRGVELWIFNAEEKAHYYEFLGAVVFLVILFMFNVLDVYNNS